MNADDEQAIAILLLQILEVGQNMQAVDAAGCPKIQQDDAIAQIFQGQRAIDVQPRQIGRQFGGTNSSHANVELFSTLANHSAGVGSGSRKTGSSGSPDGSSRSGRSGSIASSSEGTGS